MQITQILMMVIGPLVGVLIARTLSRKDALERLAIDTFHRLIKNVHGYRLAVQANQTLLINARLAQTDTSGKALDEYHAKFGLVFRELEDAITALQADSLMVKMAFGKKAAALEKEVQALIELSQMFFTLQTLQPTDADIKSAFELPIVTHLGFVRHEIEQLWAKAQAPDFEP
ncbi:MAG: hypothetical protein WD063_03705 [Pirellulales bacterium]